MKLLKSLPQNVSLCLARLFQWKEAPIAAPSNPPRSSEAIPHSEPC